MKQLSTYILLFICLGSLVFSHEGHDHGADDEVNDPDVVVLTKDNFDEIINDNEFVFAEFYAPWCGHCKRLAPEWAKLATKLKEAGSKVVVAKLDATTADDIAQKQNIRGYPTIKFFRSGQAADYEGGRTLDDLYNYALKKSGPPSKHLTSQADLDAFLASTGTKLVAFVKSGEDSDKSYSNFVKAATSLDDFLFGHVTDSALYGKNKVDTIILDNAGERYTYDDLMTKSKIVSWAQKEGYPLVDELAQKIWQRSQQGPTPLLAGFMSKTDNADAQELFKNVAKKFKGEVLFSQSSEPSLAERWGSSGRVYPTAILIQWVGSDPKMTVYDEEGAKLDEKTLEAFVKDSIAGTYKSYMKSEPIPEKNDDPVKVIVGKNFDTIVNDKSKDVFVEFYAPWCGHCKKLAPIWDELGEVFEDNENIVIAKMDATANTPPANVEVRGFPTIIFFPADNKEGVAYNGERDLDTLIKFVKEKASHSVDIGEKDGKVDL